MLVCALCLYPATPGWGVRCGCVCLDSGFGCAPPLLAGALGCVCASVRAPIVPRHSWLGCAVWVRVLWLWFRLHPATPGWGVGVCVCLCAHSACTMPLVAWLCGMGACARARVSAAPRHSWLVCWGVCVCLCARSACTPPLPAGVWGLGGCAWALVSAAPRHSWLGCWGVCVLGARSTCAPPLLAGVCGVDVGVWAWVMAAPRLSWLGYWGVRVCVRTSLVPRHSWLGCWGVCVCLCACSSCTPPLLAGVCGVGACAWARVSAAPRNSWLGCWDVCVLVWAPRLYPATPGWVVRCGCACLGSGLGCAPPLLAGVFGCVCVFVCLLRLYPAIPGWGVRCGCACFGSGFSCAPPLLAGASGCVRVCVLSLLVPRHSWLGCVVWVCLLGLRFRLRPATPGWGVGVCVCLCGRSTCAPPLLAGVCGVGVRAWARVSAAPRHSWLGCWGVCVCLCACSSCTPPLLAGVRGVGGCAWALVSAPPRHSWQGCWGVCVCLCACSTCTPPLLAGVCGVGVRAWGRVSAAPHHSWLGHRGVCVFVCTLRLYPATPGWAVWCGCVCLGSGFGCTPPLLAGVSGCVCACVRALLVLRHSWLGFLVCGFGVAWHLSLCRGLLRVVRAARVCGTRLPLVLGTCPCVLVVAGCVPLWRAWWPRSGAPRLVRSGLSRCSGRLSRRRGAVPHPGGARYWVAARGTRRPAENRALCACRWPLPWLGSWARSASYPFGAPRCGCPWRVPQASVLGCVRCDGWRVWTRSLTRPVSRTVRLSKGDSAGAPGLFRVDADTAPFRVGESHARVPCVCACVCPSWPGWVGWPPGRVVVRLTFFCGLSCCALCLLGPLRAGVALFLFFLFVRPGCLRRSLFSGPGCPLLVSCPPLLLRPLFFFPLCAPVVSGVPCFPARGALGLGVFLSTPPPPLFFFLLFLALLVPPPLAFFFAFPSLCAPVVPCVPVFSDPGCLGPWRLLVSPSPPIFLFFSAFPLSCFCSSRGFFFSLCAPPLSLAFRVFRPGVPWALASSCLPLPPLFLLFFCFSSLLLFLLPLAFFFAFFSLCAPVVSCVPCFPARGALSLGVSLSPPPFFASPRSFFSSSPGSFFCAPVVSGVPCAQAWGALGLGALLLPPPPPFCFFLPVCFLLFVFFSSSVPCWWCGAGLVCVSWAVGCAGVCFGGAVPVVALCAVLSRPSGAGWCCVVLPVVFGCLLLGLAVLRCLLVGPGVVFRWCCPCLAAWLPVVWCGVSWCSAALCCVLWRCAVVWWCAVVLCCLFASWPVRVVCFLPLASVVCVLGSCAVWSLSSAPCAVLCCAVLVPLCCAVRVVCAVSGAWCCWFRVSLCVFGGPLVALVAPRCCLVVCVGLGVPVWPRLPSLGVFPVVSCSPVLCPVALCCRVVLCCGALCFSFPSFFALLVALIVCFP